MPYYDNLWDDRSTTSVLNDQELEDFLGDRLDPSLSGDIGIGLTGGLVGAGLGGLLGTQWGLRHLRRGQEQATQGVNEILRRADDAVPGSFSNNRLLEVDPPTFKANKSKNSWWIGKSGTRPQPFVVMDGVTGERLSGNEHQQAVHEVRRSARRKAERAAREWADDFSTRWARKNRLMRIAIPVAGAAGGAGLGLLIRRGILSGGSEKTASTKLLTYAEPGTETFTESLTMSNRIRQDPRTKQHYVELMSNDPILALKASGMEPFWDDSGYAGLFKISPEQAAKHRDAGFRKNLGTRLPLSVLGGILGGGGIGALSAIAEGRIPSGVEDAAERARRNAIRAGEDVSNVADLPLWFRRAKPKTLAKRMLGGAALGAGLLGLSSFLKAKRREKPMPLLAKGRARYGMDKESSYKSNILKRFANVDPRIAGIGAIGGGVAGSYVTPENFDVLGGVLGAGLGAGLGAAGSGLIANMQKQTKLRNVIAKTLGGMALVASPVFAGRKIADLRRKQLVNADIEEYLANQEGR